ncbi:hypothetical protein acdb102_33380 [Acidothermaceae bacterium B102]|nr:hypothetical protein acdb102_33380 [Acidothermaceae bacterium B102]
MPRWTLVDDRNPAASTADPQPANTSQKVPKNSAARRLRIGGSDGVVEGDMGAFRDDDRLSSGFMIAEDGTNRMFLGGESAGNLARVRQQDP